MKRLMTLGLLSTSTLMTAACSSASHSDTLPTLEVGTTDDGVDDLGAPDLGTGDGGVDTATDADAKADAGADADARDLGVDAADATVDGDATNDAMEVGDTSADSTDAAETATVGALTITITAPTGDVPSVTVSGPGGFSKTISATTTFTDLAPGFYSVSGAPVPRAGAIFDDDGDQPSFTGNPASVSVGASSTVGVTYAPGTTAGQLWLLGTPGATSSAIAALPGSALVRDTGVSTSVVLTSSADTMPPPVDMTIDPSNTLWVLDATDHVEVYPASARLFGITITPTVTLDVSASVGGGTRLAIAGDGSLWIASGAGKIVQFAASSLSASGAPTPEVTLTSTAWAGGATGLAFAGANLWTTGASGPLSLVPASALGASGDVTSQISVSLTAASDVTFASLLDLGVDASGGLWVASPTSLLNYASATASASGSPEPDSNGTGFTGVSSLAIDAHGNGWIASSTTMELASFFAGVTVSSDATGTIASPVAFAFDTGGDVWVANGSARTIVELAASAITSSGSPPAFVSIVDAPPSPDVPAAAAFGPDGTLWLVNQGSNALVAYAQSTLAASGSPVPDVTIRFGTNTGASLSTPSSVAIDAAGDVFVANEGGDSVVWFGPDRTGASGTPRPNAVITSANIHVPSAIALDAMGNLWVASRFDRTVSMFAASTLAAGGMLTASVVLDGSGGVLSNPSGLAFDQKGTLWIASKGTNALLGLNSAALAASGTLVPTVAISSDGTDLLAPSGVAIDTSGAVWTASATSRLVLRYLPAQLTTSGSPTPFAAYDIAGTPTPSPVALAFWPPSASLPIAH